jgi:hypothetical protein
MDQMANLKVNFYVLKSTFNWDGTGPHLSIIVDYCEPYAGYGIVVNPVKAGIVIVDLGNRWNIRFWIYVPSTTTPFAFVYTGTVAVTFLSV